MQSQPNFEWIIPLLGVFGIGLLVLLGTAVFVFWICMLVHALTNKRLTDNEKLLWVLVLLFSHFLGAIIYFFIGRSKAPTPLAQGGS
jgi:uncharacterized membrane protein YhaH (DUF805 family)